MKSNKSQKGNLIKFFAILSILVAYAFFVSSQYGAKEGLLIFALVWSSFVLCTPIADGGSL